MLQLAAAAFQLFVKRRRGDAVSAEPVIEVLAAVGDLRPLRERRKRKCDAQARLTSDIATDHPELERTDYTSMVVLADDVFERRGIARYNRDRIAVERAARSARATLGPSNTRADSSRPMFRGRSRGVRGGGAFDPMMVLFALAAALAALRMRT